MSWEDAACLPGSTPARSLVGHRVDIGTGSRSLVARSPAGRMIALGHGGIPGSCASSTCGRCGQSETPSAGFGSGLQGFWPAPERLIVLRAGQDPEVVVVDPRTRRVRGRLRLEGEVAGTVSTAGKMLRLLAPRAAIGQARLAVVRRDGTIRTVALPGITAGFAPPLNEEMPGQQASPGLAVAPTGDERRSSRPTPSSTSISTRSWSPRGSELAHSGSCQEVDRRLGPPNSLDRRRYDRGLRLELLARGEAADPIEDRRQAGRCSHRREQHARPGGRLGDPGRRHPAGFRRIGVAGLPARRDAPFRVARGEDSGYVQTAGRYAYVGSGNSARFVVVDTVAGQVLGTNRTRTRPSFSGRASWSARIRRRLVAVTPCLAKEGVTTRKQDEEARGRSRPVELRQRVVLHVGQLEERGRLDLASRGSSARPAPSRSSSSPTRSPTGTSSPHAAPSRAVSTSTRFSMSPL